MFKQLIWFFEAAYLFAEAAYLFVEAAYMFVEAAYLFVEKAYMYVEADYLSTNEKQALLKLDLSWAWKNVNVKAMPNWYVNLT